MNKAVAIAYKDVLRTQKIGAVDCNIIETIMRGVDDRGKVQIIRVTSARLVTDLITKVGVIRPISKLFQHYNHFFPF